LLGVAAGSDAGVGDDFLEAFEHLSWRFSVLSYQVAIKKDIRKRRLKREAA
jgi:hypothetical protein